MFWVELRKKTWIDWIKIVVAIDIAGVGIGLIIGFDMHVFAYMIGFLTRVLFGVLYVFVAVLILKRVFPQKLEKDEHIEVHPMDEEIIETTIFVKKNVQKFVKKINHITNTANKKIDFLLDKGETFISKRKQEIKQEVEKIIKE